jgi:hypothetical protein
VDTSESLSVARDSRLAVRPFRLKATSLLSPRQAFARPGTMLPVSWKLAAGSW